MLLGKVAAAVLFAALVSTPSSGRAEDSAAHVFCHMNWASQPDKLTECVNAQIDGARSVIRWLDWAKQSSDPAALHIISTYEACSARWSPDFHLIETCLRAGTPLTPPEK